MDINLTALQKYDAKVTKIVCSAQQVAIYKFVSEKNSWEKTGAEGTIFICSRNDNNVYAMMMLSKLNRDNFMEPIMPNMEVAQETQQYLLYRKGDDYIRAIWFYNKQECRDFADTLHKIVEKLQNQKKTDFENGLPDDKKRLITNQMNNKLNQSFANAPSDADIVSMLNKAQLKHMQQESGATRSTAPLIRPVPIQLDSLMQSSTPVHGSPGAEGTMTSTMSLGHRQRQQTIGARHSTLQSNDPIPAGGTDLLQKILTSGGSESSRARQASAQQIKSLPLNRDLAIQEFSRDIDSQYPPGLDHPSGLHSAVREMNRSKSQNASHFLLTPADFEDDHSVFVQPGLPASVGDSHKKQIHSLDKTALKRAFFDLLQNDDEFVDLFAKKLAVQLNKNH